MEPSPNQDKPQTNNIIENKILNNEDNYVKKYSENILLIPEFFHNNTEIWNIYCKKGIDYNKNKILVNILDFIGMINLIYPENIKEFKEFEAITKFIDFVTKEEVLKLDFTFKY